VKEEERSENFKLLFFSGHICLLTMKLNKPAEIVFLTVAHTAMY